MPSDWPVYDLSRDPSRCVRLDVHAVYLGAPGPDQRCPAHLVGHTEAVVIGPDDRRGVPGNPAVTGEMTRVIGNRHVRVTASFGSRTSIAREVTQSATADTAPQSPAASPAAYTKAARTPTAAAPAPGVFIGNGFDTCAAPSESAMR